ncbi:MAG: NADH-quinone oxidoreductase subunit L [Candidatus Nanopelagicales bacterium]
MSGIAAEATRIVQEAQPAEGVFSLIWLLVLAPLAGAVLLLLAGRRSNKWGHLLGVLTPLVSFGLAVVMLSAMLAQPAEERTYVQSLYEWVIVGNFKVPLAFQLDQLSMTFVMLITFVGSLIHIYSVGYMAHDPERRKFFAFLNLFVAAMLLLVLADNYLLLYVGWEGVGLASYLLIGFWQYKPEAAVAAKKAFVMNRVGDFGLSVAIMLIFVTFGTVTFLGVQALAPEASQTVLLVTGLLLLLAACGKSAQVPLQAWILDAMEGPTPVSALIHAATMVTAGVYLIVRSNFIFDLSTGARAAVIAVGVITLLFGATIGMAKDDIKKALAGSTMSQIGYMVLGAGLGPSGYAFAIFMLVAHGFYKATLFLGAGSVMHGMDDELDMRRYGGLAKYMKLTMITFLAGYLAIIGVPPFSGFYTKDKIIEAAFAEHWFVGLLAAFGAALTAFYMTRIVAMTFFGKPRWKEGTHPHESPAVMTGPMILLGLFSLGFGLVLSINNAFVDWLAPVTGTGEEELPLPAWVYSAGTLVLVLIAVALAWTQYARREVPLSPPQQVSPMTVAARRDLYGDAFNEAVFMRPGQYLDRFLVWFDNRGVDGAVNGLAATVGGLSGRMRRLQTGFARSYALSMVGGAVVVIVALGLVVLS